METMRAARMIELGKIVCEETPIRPPEDGELLVKTLEASICGSDLHVVYDGLSLFPPPTPPGFPGHEGMGTIVESRDASFAIGDMVLTCPWPTDAGCFAEFQTIAAEYCLKLPNYNGPIEYLLMAQQLGSVAYAFRRCKQDLYGKTVMVMGLGSAGCFFSYLAKRAGAAQVIASDLSEARIASGAHFGVDIAVQAEHSKVIEAVMDQTHGKGVEFLIEAVGTQKSLLQSVDLMCTGGEMLLFGLPDTSEPVLFNFHDFFRKKLTAFSEYGVQHEPNLVSFAHALNLIAQEEIDVSPMVSHHFPIEQIDEAMRTARERSDNALKVSITFP